MYALFSSILVTYLMISIPLTVCKATPLTTTSSPADISAVSALEVEENVVIAAVANLTRTSITESEVEWEYKEEFRSLCRVKPDCSQPIVANISGKSYDIKAIICVWGRNCPNLCTIAEQCLGKPWRWDCKACYFYCNRSNSGFSEPFGNYWTICNSTEEIKTTTHQPTTTTTIQPETSPTSQTTTPPVEMNTSGKTDNGSDIHTSTSKSAGCWEHWYYWVPVLLAGVALSCLYVGARYSVKIKSRLPCLFPTEHNAAVQVSNQTRKEETPLLEMTSTGTNETGSTRDDAGDDNSNTRTSEPLTPENEKNDKRKNQRESDFHDLQFPAEL